MASLNALAFFNALPSAANPAWEMPEHLSYRYWLSGAAAGFADSHKARCLVHYFQRIRLLELQEEQDTSSPSRAVRQTQTKPQRQQKTKVKKGAAQRGNGGGGGDTNAADQGGVTFTRLVLSSGRRGAAALDAAGWMACEAPLQPLIVERSQSGEGIEDAKGALQVSYRVVELPEGVFQVLVDACIEPNTTQVNGCHGSRACVYLSMRAHSFDR